MDDDLKNVFASLALLVFCTALLLIMQYTLMNKTYALINHKHKVIANLCKSEGSTPFSYDESTVTCVNGLTVNYTASLENK
jgi:hypothetical protein